MDIEVCKDCNYKTENPIKGCLNAYCRIMRTDCRNVGVTVSSLSCIKSDRYLKKRNINKQDKDYAKQLLRKIFLKQIMDSILRTDGV